MRGRVKASSARTTSSKGGLVLLASLCLAVALMGLTAPNAPAALTHPYTGTSFGPDGVGGSASFSNLQSVAVDQVTGNVFAYDAGEGGKVYKFDSSGAPVSFSGLSGNAIEGVAGRGSGEVQMAIAPAGAPGGTAGDIYIANASRSLLIFSPAGAPLGEIATGEETCGVAVDPAGHLFLGLFPSTIREYIPSANPPVSTDEGDSSSASLPNICNVAADGLGNFYASNYGGSETVRLEGLGDASAETIGNGATLAVDPATNDLYVNRSNLVVQHDSSGNVLGTSGAGELSGSYGVAVHGASGTVYAPAAADGKIKLKVFGPAVVVPGLTTEPATEVTGFNATLHGRVNPAGLAVSECKFEYGADQSYGQSKPCEGSIPTDEADHPIAATLTGLASNTTYHFRIVATNANGINRSEDQTFTTSQPAVTEAATEVGGSKATLHGTVLPEGEAVSECFFEYGTSQSFGSSVPCIEPIPTDEGAHVVSAQLSHLAPNGTEYFFRLVIRRAAGLASGETRSFQTEVTVITGAAAAINPPSATVNGTVDPEGTPFTECRFEYGLTTSYGQSAPCAESVAEIGAGTGPVDVHAVLANIAFGAVYHYRLTATNADGVIRGKDESFETPGAVIEEQFVANVGQSEATVRAKINPDGSPTTYRVEYGTDSSYGNSTPEAEVGSDEVGHLVTNILRGLTSSTTYHFRFVATNSIGTTFGPDQTFRTYTPGAEAQSCPNEVFRIGVASRLPDCRAYEMVSPVEKNGIDIDPSVDIQLAYNRLEQASTSGNALTFATSQGIGEPEGVPYAPQYLSSRGANGWQTRSLALRQELSPLAAGARVKREYTVFTHDLCHAVLQNFSATPIAPNATPDYPNLYENDLCGSGGVVGLTPEYREKPGPDNTLPPVIGGISSDGECVTYFPTQTLTLPPGAEREGVVEMCGGTRRQVSILPNGNPSDFANVGQALKAVEPLTESILKNAMSEDGSTIYWTAPKADSFFQGPLYVRVNARAEQSDLGPDDECLEPEKACTYPVSGPISGEEAFFDAAAADGSRMYFHFQAGSKAGNLYEYDLAARNSRLVATGTSPGAVAMGASHDGSKLYFASESRLAGEGTAGHRNLYLYDANAGPEGDVRFIADLTDQNHSSFFLPISIPRTRVSQVTDDGRHAVFATRARITNYDNRDASTGEPSFEVYVYDAAANGGEGKLSCVSCNPSGQRPNATRLTLLRELTSEYAAGLIPPWQTNFQTARAITDDGSKVFFEAYEALVPQDTNGRADVYQWTKEGAPGCSIQNPAYSPNNDGCLDLISSGEGAADSRLVDATANGSDVYFATSQSLVVQDPGLIDIYDARVNGGFPPPPGLPPACEGEACQGPLNPPNDPTPSSSTYRGPGNEKPVKTKKKSKKKKVKKKKSNQRKKQKQQNKGKKQRAGHNGRTAR